MYLLTSVMFCFCMRSVVDPTAGLDGMRPSCLEQVRFQELDEDSWRLLSASSKLINLILKGEVLELAKGQLLGTFLVGFKTQKRDSELYLSEASTVAI